MFHFLARINVLNCILLRIFCNKQKAPQGQPNTEKPDEETHRAFLRLLHSTVSIQNIRPQKLYKLISCTIKYLSFQNIMYTYVSCSITSAR